MTPVRPQPKGLATPWRILASFLLLAAAGTTVPPPKLPDLYVMRNLQYRGAGVDARLSEMGANNARRLATSFAAAPPKAIYTATEQVSLDTAAWLAIALGVTPRLFDPNKPDALIEQLAQERGPVLVVASRDYVASIVERAGGHPAPVVDEKTFGEIWSISGRDRSVTKRRLAFATDNPAAATSANSSGPTSSWLDEGEVAKRAAPVPAGKGRH